MAKAAKMAERNAESGYDLLPEMTRYAFRMAIVLPARIPRIKIRP